MDFHVFDTFVKAKNGHTMHFDVITDKKDIESAILEAKHSKVPFIIDAVVSSGELSLPPHIGLKEIIGFGTSKIKEGAQAITGDKKQWENLKKELKAYFD